MNVLITGNLGYIGPVLQRVLKSLDPNCKIRGFDTGFFSHALTTTVRSPDVLLSEQIYGDVRNPPEGLFDSIDVVIHLAAISNDPMGVSFEAVTDDVNHRASVNMAVKAKAAGVGRFIFASSCSMYGFAEGGSRTETDALNPLTAYARSKVATEQGLEPLADENFNVTCLRFATACGMSDRIRLDLVLNDFVAGALVSQEIDVLSDGTPWRPLIAVEDMASSMYWASQRSADKGGAFLAMNTGSDSWNFQVSELAEAVASVIPGTRVSINRDAPEDKRSYQVSFDLYKELAPDWAPAKSLEQVIGEIRDGLVAANFSDRDYRRGPLIRLATLDRLRDLKLIDTNLSWT